MANKLIESLAGVCRRNVLGQKWLIAPSLRVGWQWLETAAFCGTAVVNVSVKTVRSLAAELAGPAISAAGATMIDPLRGAMIVADEWQTLQAGGKLAFLGRLEPSLELFGRLWGSMLDLRLAGLDGEHLPAGRFEVSAKGADVAVLLRRYERRLAEDKLADDADIFSAACRAICESGQFDELAIMMPAGLARCRLESQMLECLPKDRMVVLDADRPFDSPDAARLESGRDKLPGDLELLKWINCPADAPSVSRPSWPRVPQASRPRKTKEEMTNSEGKMPSPHAGETPATHFENLPQPIGDGSVEISRCVGQANEIRNALRTILKEGLSLDEAEIICTQGDPYVGIVHELAQCYRPQGDEGPAGLPVTFADGLPAGFSRPGRALAGWLDWIQLDYPQTKLIGLLQDGLLTLLNRDESSGGEPGSGISGKNNITTAETAVEHTGKMPVPHSELSATDADAMPAKLAGLLRSIRIGLGIERYVPAVESHLRAMAKRLETPEPLADGDFERQAETPDAIRRRISGMEKLLQAVQTLVRAAPSGRSGPAGLIRSARYLLDRLARSVSEHDNLSRQGLIERIDRMLKLLEGRRADFLDAFGWLRSLLADVRVGGSRPRPGCLHVAGLTSGGCSGRARTFIVGLDDGSFPGSVRADPILLDHERAGLSGELATRPCRMAERLDEFGRLLCGLRGKLTLSFSCRDIGDERELFPAGVLLSAYRLISGRRNDDQTAMLRQLPAPASFAPDEGEACLDEGQWWLGRCCGGAASIAPAVLESCRPNIARGRSAVKARTGSRFTEFDGRVPDAALKGDAVMSAHKFQTLGACPLRYFFRYALGVEPGVDVAVDPAGWLNHAEYGGMLHEVFHDFMAWAIGEGGAQAVQPDSPKMKEILAAGLARWAEIFPPPAQAPYLRQRRQAQQATDIFLAEEQLACQNRRPLYVEASIGMPPVGDGTPIDAPEPVTVNFGGHAIRIQGRIDRIDELAGGGYVVVDYKTGRLAGSYEDPKDPFNGGRILQHALYCRMVGRIFAGKAGREPRVLFEYFFPGHAASGRRTRFEPEQLAGADEVISSLWSLATAGCFPASTFYKDDGNNDCRFCDYAAVCAACGGLELTCRASRAKLARRDNVCLQPWLPLRGEDGE
ncbi:MAG: PD-(D/E)XK nuclease family protein [Planctomycetes bacterium]|nr:PD-(D/E)XK nuclease family protein [Planctomycetota bacterium]